jgi:hypothetical protein
MKVSDIVYNGPVTGTEDFQEVVGVELGGGYGWDSLQAWYSPSKRKFFWLEGSGCSCNSLGKFVSSLGDFTVGNRDELVNAVRAKYDNSYSIKTGMASALLNDLATVKTFRPAALSR